MDEIASPTLIIDEDICRRNIRNMAAKATHSKILFRPHFKTHQSLTVGRWFREAGVNRIAVSSFSMANYFANDGWKDIMVAFPVNIREIALINELSSKINLSILLADADVLDTLEQNLTHLTGFYIKVDVGNLRSGFDPENVDAISALLEKAGRNLMLEFRGFVAHAGQAYQTHSLNDVHKIYKTGTEQLHNITSYFKNQYPGILSSWGDTPTCSLVNEFHDSDEIRPGNFVFHDLTQFHLASCDWEHIGVAVAAPVVSRQKERNEIVLYAGAVHLSKDFVKVPDAGKVYGEIVKLTPDGWLRYSDPLYVTRISQEHGIFSCPDEFWDDFLPGSLAGIIPVHSCLTADLLRHNRFYNLKTAEFIE